MYNPGVGNSALVRNFRRHHGQRRSRNFPHTQINFPQDFNTNFLMLVRWIHFLAGITWIGLLYFFNLVNVPLMKELDATTKGKVMPALMTRALWWFRMSAALMLAGLIYWGNIVAADAHNGGGPAALQWAAFF